jgi:hypothetical protein
MATTYEKIATTTLGSAASDITFSSIPSTYTDLRLVWVGTTSTTNNLYIQFNSNTANNYSDTWLYGDGSAGSYRVDNQPQIWLNIFGSVDTTIPALFEVDIFSYAGSTFKTVLHAASGDKNGSGGVDRGVHLWRQTSAINTIKIFSQSPTNLKAGTTATLYGILKA